MWSECSQSLLNMASSSSSSPAYQDSTLPLGVSALSSETPFINFLPPNSPTHEAVAEQPILEPAPSIPVIDLSLLFGPPYQRSKAIADIAEACQSWGFFMVINHGIPWNLQENVLNSCKEFMELPEQDQQVFWAKEILDPISSGAIVHVNLEDGYYLSDFLKVFVHPIFHSPPKPPQFSDIAREYTTRIRGIASELLKAIWESLRLDSWRIEKNLELERGLQMLIADVYPICPQPKLATGMPILTDHGLLTLIIQNGEGGIEFKRDGNWIRANPIPGSILVNTGDHLEIVTNGKYKTVSHRAVVSLKTPTVSVAVTNGPAIRAVVSPSLELVRRENTSPDYMGMRYMDYLELQEGQHLICCSCIENVRVTKL